MTHFDKFSAYCISFVEIIQSKMTSDETIEDISQGSSCLSC